MDDYWLEHSAKNPELDIFDQVCRSHGLKINYEAGRGLLGDIIGEVATLFQIQHNPRDTGFALFYSNSEYQIAIDVKRLQCLDSLK